MIPSRLLVAAALLLATGCAKNSGDYLQRAESLYRQRKYDDASIEYRNALRANPASAESHFGLALIALQAKRGTEALHHLKRARELAPANESIAANLADLNLAAALQYPDQTTFNETTDRIASELIARNPDSFDGWRIRGLLARQKGNFQDAIECLRRAESIRPSHIDVAEGLVASLLEAKRPAEAEEFGNEFLSRRKPDSGGVAELLYKHYFAEKRYQDAANVLEGQASRHGKETRPLDGLVRHFHALRQPAEKQAALRRLMEKDNGYLAAAAVLESIGELAEAGDILAEGESKDPARAELYRKRAALNLLAQGNADEAGKRIAAVLGQEKSDRDALLLRAALRVAQSDTSQLAEAAKDLRQLHHTYPADGEIIFQLARAEAKLGHLPDAAALLRKGIAVIPEPRSLATRNLLAEVLLSEGKPGDAIQVTGDTLLLFPRNPRARLLQVSCLTAAAQLGEARSQLALLARDYPKDYEIGLQVALVALRDKKYAEAQSAFAALQARDPKDTRAIVGLAQTLVAAGQPAQALVLLQKEVEAAPKVESLRVFLAESAARAGRLGLAIEQLRHLASASAQPAQYLQRLGDLYRENGEFANSMATLEKLPPGAAAAVSLGLTLEKLEKYSEAMAQYRKALTFGPYHTVALNNLAFLLAEKGGDLVEAQTLIAKALRSRPDDPGLLDTQAWIYLKQGNANAALRILKPLAAKYPEIGAVRYHYGAALLEKGAAAQGKAELREALAKGSGPGDTAAMRSLLAK